MTQKKKTGFQTLRVWRVLPLDDGGGLYIIWTQLVLMLCPFCVSGWFYGMYWQPCQT